MYEPVRKESALFWDEEVGALLMLIFNSWQPTWFAIGPAPHRVFPEESEKSPERVLQGRVPKVPKECGSQKTPKRVRKSGFRLFSDSFETPGCTLSALLGPSPGVLFPDSFRTLPGFRARRARETLCGAGPIAKLGHKNFRRWPEATLRPSNGTEADKIRQEMLFQSDTVEADAITGLPPRSLL